MPFAHLVYVRIYAAVHSMCLLSLPLSLPQPFIENVYFFLSYQCLSCFCQCLLSFYAELNPNLLILFDTSTHSNKSEYGMSLNVCMCVCFIVCILATNTQILYLCIIIIKLNKNEMCMGWDTAIAPKTLEMIAPQPYHFNEFCYCRWQNYGISFDLTA